MTALSARHIVLVILVAMLPGSAQAVAGGHSSHQVAMVARADAAVMRLRLAAGHLSLVRYSRYYAFDERGNRPVIVVVVVAPSVEAEFERARGRSRPTSGLPENVYLFGDGREAPGMADGGCARIAYVIYDVLQQKIVAAPCAGIAYPARARPSPPRLPPFLRPPRKTAPALQK